MKFALLVGDGMADYPLQELEGHTPLEAADTPNMDRLAREGTVGIVRTIPSGMPPGSDIANLNLLGYDVAKYYSGRAPLEAASRNIELSYDEVAFRCNLVTIIDNVMIDYSAGHISSEEAAELIAAVDSKLGGASFRFHPGVSYRHLLIARSEDEKRWESGLECTPPHDIVGQSVAAHMPRGEDEQLFKKLMLDSVGVLTEHRVNRRRSQSGKRPANMIWLWGQGKRPSMPTFAELYGMTGTVISAVDLIRGMGKYAGLSIVEVPGATGYFDTNYAGKASYGLDALAHGDFLFVHVESPDEAGHVGDIEEKIKAIENFDKLVVGPIVDGMSRSEPYRVMVLPDHFTPIKVGTHVADPVPFLVHGSGVPQSHASGFSEAEAEKAGSMIENGFELLPSYLKV
ncbi:MAG: cofactor-independent phosphoglycerate mutase [Candidatus Hydrogenedentota bacterium]|nr:MAG: cofactor-independent phosphoglycerate mutase [Candidatus Hydrogenedentota bacterium]